MRKDTSLRVMQGPNGAKICIRYKISDDHLPQPRIERHLVVDQSHYLVVVYSSNSSKFEISQLIADFTNTLTYLPSRIPHNGSQKVATSS